MPNRTETANWIHYDDDVGGTKKQRRWTEKATGRHGQFGYEPADNATTKMEAFEGENT